MDRQSVDHSSCAGLIVMSAFTLIKFMWTHSCFCFWGIKAYHNIWCLQCLSSCVSVVHIKIAGCVQDTQHICMVTADAGGTIQLLTQVQRRAAPCSVPSFATGAAHEDVQLGTLCQFQWLLCPHRSDALHSESIPGANATNISCVNLSTL